MESIVSTIRNIWNVFNSQPVCVCRYCEINTINFSNFELGYYLYEINKLEFLRPMCKTCFVEFKGVAVNDLYDNELKKYLYESFNLPSPRKYKTSD